MRSTLNKIALTAGFALAITFTFSCSGGGGGDTSQPPEEEISSPSEDTDGLSSGSDGDALSYSSGENVISSSSKAVVSSSSSSLSSSSLSSSSSSLLSSSSSLLSSSSNLPNSSSSVGNSNLLFSEDFNGTSLDASKWDYCPEWDRQGRSTWKDDMVSVSGGYLHLKFKKDPALGATKSDNPEIANNWIRASGIRGRSSKDYSKILWQNTYGYYEARIKFPKISGTWGAFWLMSPTVDQDPTNGGEEGTEIDIVETIDNSTEQFNAALHWNGYAEHHKDANSGKNASVDIYDGEFHIFAVNWTPTEYVFYVDGIEFWRVDGGASCGYCGINQNPNYIKLTTESGDWAADIPAGFTEAEMLVDYVKVYKQRPETLSPATPPAIKLVRNTGADYDNWQGFFDIGTRITTGNTFTVDYAFTSNVAISELKLMLVDNSEGAGWWNSLSAEQTITNIAAGTTVTGTKTFTATGTATATSAMANRLSFQIDPVTGAASEPTLTFTQFSLTKN